MTKFRIIALVFLFLVPVLLSQSTVTIFELLPPTIAQPINPIQISGAGFSVSAKNDTIYFQTAEPCVWVAAHPNFSRRDLLTLLTIPSDAVSGQIYVQVGNKISNLTTIELVWTDPAPPCEP